MLMNMLTKPTRDRNMYEVKVSDKNFKEALKRHEKKFQEELESISNDEQELKKMLLKIKKSLLEQARQNNSTYGHASDAVNHIKNFQAKLDNFERITRDLDVEMKKNRLAFTQAITLLNEDKKSKRGFWQFIKDTFFKF